MTGDTVPDRLAHLAQERPNAVALDGPDGPITFAGLWAACSATAAVVAERLAGADHGRPVAILVTAGGAAETQALLAVMAAGHVPLLVDPRAPGALQREWVRAAGARLVLVDERHAVTAHRRFGVPVVALAQDGRQPGPTPRPVGAGDPALLAPDPHHADGRVTVGSLTHAAVLRRAADDAQAIGLGGEDRLATPLPLSSPLGTRAVLTGLLAGVTTVLGDPVDASVLALTPTLVALANARPAVARPKLRAVMVLAPSPTGPVTLDAAPAALFVLIAEWAADLGAREPVSPDAEVAGADLDAVEATLVALWQELLGIHPVGLQDDFFDLGGYSLLAARLLVLLEQRTGTRLAMAVFLDATTIEQLAAAVRASGDPGSQSAVVLIRDGDPALPPLFVTHDLQGSAWRFRGLADAVGGDQPVYGFESPMLEGRLDHPTIEALAAHYVAALRTVAPTGPYQLCGYSFGGVLAFEMARVLRSQGDEVALLGIIDVGPGYRGLDYSRTDHPPLPYLHDAIEQPSDRLPRWATPVRRLWLNRRVLARRWRRLLARGETIPPDERLWFAWWAHWNLVGPQWDASAYDGRIDLFWAETTTGTDDTLGWASFASEVVVHRVAGEHVDLMEPPAVLSIGGGLRDLLVADPRPTPGPSVRGTR